MFSRFYSSNRSKGRRYILGLVLLVLPLSLAIAANIAVASNIANQDSDGDKMARIFQSATQYITVSEDRTVHLNIDDARKGGLDKEAIDLVKDYIKLQNQSVKELARGKSNPSANKEMFDRFRPFFSRVATKGLGDIPASAGFSTMTDACGGSSDNPHPCPARINSGIYFFTRAGVETHLLNNGYHKTAGYACGDSPDDYSKVVSAFNCNGGPFRKQAIIFPHLSRWTYWTQSPEPNPEIFSYTWPAWWWGGYVQWWHQEWIC